MSFKPSVKTEWNGPAVIADFDKANFRALSKAATVVLSSAVARVAVDLAQLKGSLTKSVSKDNATVGTNDEKAPYIEFGTRPHTAPISALQGWANRHGIPVGAVWTSIKRKGTKAQPFLLPSLTGNINRIIEFFRQEGINLKWVDKRKGFSR